MSIWPNCSGRSGIGSYRSYIRRTLSRGFPALRRRANFQDADGSSSFLLPRPACRGSRAKPAFAKAIETTPEALIVVMESGPVSIPSPNCRWISAVPSAARYPGGGGSVPNREPRTALAHCGRRRRAGRPGHLRRDVCAHLLPQPPTAELRGGSPTACRKPDEIRPAPFGRRGAHVGAE